jgi:hypothetical protein
MIVLDTNVLSELVRPRPSARVVDWVDRQPVGQLATTTVTEAELRFGVLRLPRGKKRQHLGAVLERLFDELLAGRVLPFDRGAAKAYAAIASQLRSTGEPRPQLDLQIAAITHHAEAALATRNLADFRGCGLDLIDPWDASDGD